MLLTGLDRCIADGFARFRGQRVGLVCNQASIARDYGHVLDHMLKEGVEVVAVFGPQHGSWGHTQDNMVEWEGYRDPRTGLPFHSLYGEHRQPTVEMLQEVERLIFDVPDVGARYYTFIWTLANCMAAGERDRIPVTVLDRPNPIGSQVEGPGLQPGFKSFVGLHPLPARHGMTVGEIATYFQSAFYADCELEVVELSGWDRAQYLDETDLPWVMTSPNMPTVDTAIVYPGQCLLEGTNLSEGRGTTRPFEVFGAPWIDEWELTERLNCLSLRGAHFRPYQFQPTFQKYAGQICHGAFIHVTDRRAFHPVAATIAILLEVWKLWPGHAEWRQPPYEYETELLPFDILAGNDWLRPAIETDRPFNDIQHRMASEADQFEVVRLYI